MISIGRISATDAAAYYLDRQAGCELDYYTGAGESRGRWLGDGAAALGLNGRLNESGEQALRALLTGCAADGDRLVGQVLRTDPRSRLAAEPLVHAIEALRTAEAVAITLSRKDTASLRAAANRIPASRSATLTVDVVRRVAASYGLDPVALYRQPDGTDRYAEALRHADDRVDVRRPGLDVTVSAPKSVSFLFGLGDPAIARAARAAHEVAVGEVISYLQRHAATAVRGHHGDGHRASRIGSDGLIIAGFDHRTSRAGDPQLHTHLVIPNLVRGADLQWSAMDTAAVYRHARTASSVYHAVLRGELTRTLGVGWTPVRQGVADIDGIPRTTIDQFSKRRAQITAALAHRGKTGAKSAQAACLDTRPAKRHEPVGTLRDRWREEAAAAGLQPDAITSVLGVAGVPTGPRIDELAARLLGPEGVTADRTTFTKQDLARALCEALPAGTQVRLDDLDQLILDLTSRPDVIPVINGDAVERRYTTRELLETEQEALRLATTAPAQPVGLAGIGLLDRELQRADLTEEQVAMVTTLVTSGRRVDVVAGPAGAGKTAALSEATWIWRCAGHPVQGVTVSWLAAQQLEWATGLPTSSLTKTLFEADRHGLPAGVVMVLDEASLVNTRAAARLIRHIDAADGKLVLVGDPYQLPEIGAGGLFGTLANRAETIRLAGNQRQQERWERDALQRLRDGDPVTALDAYQAHDRIHTAPDSDALLAEIAADYQAARDRGDDVLVLAARRSDVAALNRTIRAHLIDTRVLGPDEVTIATEAGERSYRVGDQVLVTANDRSRGLINGARGTVTTVNTTTGHLQLTLSDDHQVTLDPTWLAGGALAHGYATTVHKAQGLTVDTTLVYGLGPLTREHGYVALSRGRSANHLYLTADSPAAAECGPVRPTPERDTRALTAEVRERLRQSRRQRLASAQLRTYGRDDDYYSLRRSSRDDDYGRDYGRGR